MPELPDVEVYRRRLEERGLRQVIKRVDLRGAGRMLGETRADDLRRALEGHALTRTARHGKYLFARSARGPWLVLHFGMTGYLAYGDAEEADPKHDVLVLWFANGRHLAFNCRRKLGAIRLTDTPESFIESKHLGPDVLALSESEFMARLRNKGGSAKGLLMDQATLAGLGNVYSDEVLFQAGIHPKAPVDTLDQRQRRALFHALRQVLAAAIAADAEPTRMPPRFLTPLRGKRQAHCPYCGGAPQRISAVGRHAWYCPCRQPDPGRPHPS